MSFTQVPFLVSDLDGTLLTSKQEVSLENMQSIQHYQQSGGIFTLATGRSYSEAKRFLEKFHLTHPVILCNGTMVFEPVTKSLAPVKSMHRDVMLSMIEELEKVVPDSVDIVAYGLDEVYATKIGSLAQQRIDSIDFKLESFTHMPVDTPCIKVVAVAHREEMQLLVEWSKKVDYPVEFVPSSDDYFEMLPKGTSKGNAVLTLLEQVNISPEHAAAIGDHLNDLSMLQEVGLPAAVANAHPVLLQEAKIIVPSNNEHGVSHLIHNHLMAHVPSKITPHPEKMVHFHVDRSRSRDGQNTEQMRKGWKR